MKENGTQYSKIRGNVYFIYFLSFLLIAGASLAIVWSVNFTFNSLLMATALSLQLLSLTIYTCVIIDENYKWEDNFIQRLLIQLIVGSLIPYTMVVGINHIIAVISDNNVISPLYSKNFIPFSIMINFCFNACVTVYLYMYTIYNLTKNEQDLALEKQDLTNTYPEHLLGKNGKQEFILDLNEVSYMQVIDKVVLIYYSDNEVYSLMKTLKHVQSMLDPDRFMQINRSYIVCRKVISSYKKRNDGGLKVILFYNEKEVPVSISAVMAETSINWFAK